MSECICRQKFYRKVAICATKRLWPLPKPARLREGIHLAIKTGDKGCRLKDVPRGPLSELMGSRCLTLALG